MTSRNGTVIHLFVYGSLVDRKRLSEVIQHPHTGETLRATLPDFRRVEVAEYGFPFLVTSPGDQVDGLLIMDLSTTDIEAIDSYEDVAQDVYRRVEVTVAAYGCGPRPAMIGGQTYVGGAQLQAMARVSGASAAR